MKQSVIFVAVALGVIQPVCVAAQTGDALLGSVIVRESCAACHRIAATDPIPPPVHDMDQELNVQAPDFSEIARRYRGNPEGLRLAITRPHYPMREQRWHRDDLDAVVAYIGALH